MKAPLVCPICGEKEGWKLIDETNKGFSGGKAVVGAALLGPIGAVAGAMGKKKQEYICTKCGFTHDYSAK